MSKSLVDRYEQILAQDPSSTAFVELAKALIDKGELTRAMDVCQQGVLHHAGSVVGRVLWGKALIHLGRPAEAMEQFDRAVAIDKENPHAYNLIAEVLLQKGLYRSALPLLKKAVALQPNDARMRDWLEQTQSALNGGPAPVLQDVGMLDSAASTGQPPPPPETTAPFPAVVEETQVKPAALALAPPAPPEQEAPRVDPPEGGPPVLYPSTAPAAGPSTEGEGPTALLSSAELRARMAQDPSSTLPLPQPGLLGDVPTVPPPSAPPPEPRTHLMAPHEAKESSGLLGDIPELGESPSQILKLPKVEVSPQAAEAIAKEYERELRARLAEEAQRKTFLQKHGVKLAIASVVTLVAAAAGGGFVLTRARHHGKDLKDSLAFARKSFASDTAAGYRAGLQALDQALEMDATNEETWAMRAYGESLLFAEHGGAVADQKEAQKALEQPDVEAKHPGLALVSRWYAATPGEREVARRAVLASTLEQAEVKELAGRLLLQKKDSQEAVARFTAALALSPNNVRALVALGNYYREAGDYGTALQFYGTAGQISPQHVERAVGAAESRLALNQDLPQAMEDLDRLPAGEDGSPELLVRRELVRGRLLAATGHPSEGLAVLQAGLAAHPTRVLDFELALGEAERMAGDMPAAQKAYEAAVKAQPRSEDAREGLGRVLLAEDREREVLSRLPAEDDARKVNLVRGAAWARLGDWKRARAELQKTQVGGKFPVEAVMYLALADAAEGQVEKAQTVLEKAQQSAKKARSGVEVALGQVYWQRGLTAKAQKQFEDASRDPLDYEGACALGRLFLSEGEPRKALEPLTLAVQRNGAHGEARHALGRTLLALGRVPEGEKQAEEWLAEAPGSAKAQKDVAFALLASGRSKEAEAMLNRALKLEPQDAEGHRLKAQALFARGDARSAVDELQRANKLNPKDPETFCAIGRAYLRQGNSATALKAFEAALREAPTSACGKVGVLAAGPAALPKSGLKELQDLVQHAPAVWDRAWAAATLARAQLALGNAREARRTAEGAAQQSPFLAEAYAVQGAASLKLKDEARAKDGLEKAVALDPTQAAYHLALADFLARGDAGAAAASEYGLFLRLNTSKSPEVARVKKLLPQLKKRLARRG